MAMIFAPVKVGIFPSDCHVIHSLAVEKCPQFIKNLPSALLHLPGVCQWNYCGRIRRLLGYDKTSSRRRPCMVRILVVLRHRNVSGWFKGNHSFAVPGMGCVADATVLQKEFQVFYSSADRIEVSIKQFSGEDNISSTFIIISQYLSWRLLCENFLLRNNCTNLWLSVRKVCPLHYCFLFNCRNTFRHLPFILCT